MQDLATLFDAESEAQALLARSAQCFGNDAFGRHAHVAPGLPADADDRTPRIAPV